MYLYTTTPQKGENKKLEVRGKQNNTAKQEEAVSLFSVLYCIPQHLLFSTRAAINANVQRGEWRENNYPLPQPAGLFINMQLWFHGSPLYTSHSRAKKKKPLPRHHQWKHLKHCGTADSSAPKSFRNYAIFPHWLTGSGLNGGELGLFGALPEAADEAKADITMLWWVIADLINGVTKTWSQTNKEDKFWCFAMSTNWRRFPNGFCILLPFTNILPWNEALQLISDGLQRIIVPTSITWHSCQIPANNNVVWLAKRKYIILDCACAIHLVVFRQAESKNQVQATWRKNVLLMYNMGIMRTFFLALKSSLEGTWQTNKYILFDVYEVT